MKTRHFQDLQVWQKGMNLVQLVYAATNEFPKAEIFGLTSQMRRAAISVPSNIAEGHGLATEKQFVHSLCQARGSLYELHTQIEVAMRLEYLRTQDGASLIEECGSIARMLNALLRTLKES